MKHNCPFLSNHEWCDIKRRTPKRIKCIYKDCRKCPYYQDSKSEAKDEQK